MNRRPRKISCTLFDMDGVLVDVSSSYREAILGTAAHFLGRPIGRQVVQDFKDRGGFNDDWELTHAILSAAGVNVEFSDVVDEFQRRYRGSRWDGLIVAERPLVDSALLRALRKQQVTLGIVTGRPEEEAIHAIERFGWGPFFDVVLAREAQADRPKPDPFPLLRALELLAPTGSHSPRTTAYVGDTVDDMISARAAGMFAIGFVPPYLNTERHCRTLLNAGAEAVIDDLHLIRQLIQPARSP